MALVDDRQLSPDAPTRTTHGALVKIHAIRLAASTVLLALAVSCSSGSDGGTPGAGQFSASSTTTTSTDTTTSTAPSEEPKTPEEFGAAEHSHEEGRSGEGPDWVDGSVGSLDQSDPRATAVGWGCALRSKAAGESSEAWSLRLSGPATSKAREKLSSITSRAVPSTDEASIIGGYLEVESDDVQRWRVDCEVVTFAPGGERVSYDSTTPVRVVLVNEGGKWLVDDFGWGGIELAG